MTREQAQVYAKLSKEDIAKIDCGYERHYEVLCSFANGMEIQMEEDGGKWTDISEPYFYYSCEYRVNPIVETAEPWKPKDGEQYFCVKGSGDVVGVRFINDSIGNEYLDFGNCFRTREEAEAERERVRAALKGGTLSKTETVEPVESLDGEPLTEGEKDLIRALRVSGIDGIFTEKNSCLFNGGGNCGEYTQYSDFVAIDTNLPADIEDVINALVKIREEQDKAAEAAFG